VVGQGLDDLHPARVAEALEELGGFGIALLVHLRGHFSRRQRWRLFPVSPAQDRLYVRFLVGLARGHPLDNLLEDAIALILGFEEAACAEVLARLHLDFIAAQIFAAPGALVDLLLLVLVVDLVVALFAEFLAVPDHPHVVDAQQLAAYRAFVSGTLLFTPDSLAALGAVEVAADGLMGSVMQFFAAEDALLRVLEHVALCFAVLLEAFFTVVPTTFLYNQ
jgi:hypothetical protein